ncbi:MAG: VOC family protein [Pseudomonadota bacterium]
METLTRSASKAFEIAYVRFALPDLAPMEAFLGRFGMTPFYSETPDGRRVLYAKGYGGSPFIYEAVEGEKAFIGLGFEVHSIQCLEKLATMEGSSPIERVAGPGAGQRVRFIDPNGYEIDAICDRQHEEPSCPEERVGFNWASNRQRLGQPVRLTPGPSPVRRVGHCVLNVHDFRASERWYKERFGFVTSDEIFLEDEQRTLGAFLRFDKGAEPADHHSIFLVGSGTTGLNHIAFEVEDWDRLMLGHSHLEEHGYEKHWGIGKHLLGSQVFDYWKDPYGFVLEHYTDGDVFDASVPPKRESRETLLGVQWGAKAPHETKAPS